MGVRAAGAGGGSPRSVLVLGTSNSLLGKQSRRLHEDCQSKLSTNRRFDVAAFAGVRAQVRAPPDLSLSPAALSRCRVIRPRLQARGACGPAQLLVEAREHYVLAQRGDCVVTGQGCRELHRIVRPQLVGPSERVCSGQQRVRDRYRSSLAKPDRLSSLIGSLDPQDSVARRSLLVVISGRAAGRRCMAGDRTRVHRSS